MKHRFLVPAEHIQTDVVTFSTEQWHQLHAVLRVRMGDQVRVFDGREPVDTIVEIVAVQTGRVVGRSPQATEPRTRLVAYPALLQRDKFEPVLQKLTEIGAAAIVPVLTVRSLIREAPDERRQTRWLSILREATEQCGRGVVPELEGALPFAQAVERATAAGTVLIAYEGEKRGAIRDALSNAERTVSIFVGPEGGYTPEEIAQAVQAGGRLLTLGPRILRAETASPLLAGLVLYELGDLTSCAR